MSEVLSSVKTAEIIMAKRERIKLQRVESADTPKSDALVIWYDSRAGDPAVMQRIPQVRYTGVVLYPDNADQWLPVLGSRLRKIMHVNSADEWRATQQKVEIPDLIWSSADVELLGEISTAGLPTCYRAYVDDSQSLHAAIEQGSRHDFLMVSFRDPTNIPLELVIASLQASQTVLIKEITDPKDFEDALVTLGVMEVGAEGVLFTPREHADLDAFLSRLDTVESPRVKIEVGTVVRSVPVGMGYRSCIDLATLFSPNEGMIVGSTSQGGILCCPEVFFLPYM
jgi:3-dehydroquinate synthase II/3-amino-4-hydroxybenzoic acid synthase